MARKFRGITGAVRRAINRGDLRNQITYDGVRKLLPEEKRLAPDKVIRASLARMANQNEIRRNDGSFFVKRGIDREVVPPAPTAAAPTPSKGEVMIVGKLVNTSMRDGKIIAEVEVTSLDNK